LTITYPSSTSTTIPSSTSPSSKEKSQNQKKETFSTGARIDVPAGKIHEVWMGNEGCEYVIGEQ
jgi:hypothetical protein